jgi:Icc-related predicted phosphoesterase
MRITFISDTHSKHKQITNDLIGGDLIIHSGDITSVGKEHEIYNFCKWFSKLDNYKHKVFIPGNHDLLFENLPNVANDILKKFTNITMLKDSFTIIDDVKIYGSPWQPEFNDWAFNLPKNGDKLEKAWSYIPTDTDILITHGPSFGTLDRIAGEYLNLGCEKLTERLQIIQTKLHCCGHIHSARGYMSRSYDSGNYTHHFNACVLNEEYNYYYKPMTIDWDKETNDVIFI